MQYDFYILEAGPESRCQIRQLNAVSVAALPDAAVDSVNEKFQELVQSNPEIADIIVIQSRAGDPGGTIVAVELMHAWPVEVRERQGKPPRELRWVVDSVSTGLVGAA